MKRFFKITGILLGLLVLLGAVFALFVSVRGIPEATFNMPADLASLKVPTDSAHVERGAKIAALLCKECHRGADNKLIGQELKEMPAEFGKVYSLNITRDSEHGIGAWTDGELYYFLRTGIRKDNSWAPPTMPKFSNMADDDLYAVIAWLRSDDPMLQPDPREFPPNQYNFLVKLLCNTVFFPPPYPPKTIAIPDSTNRVAFGKYVANDLSACYGCHSADFKTNNDLFPEKSKGFYGGGNPMLNREREIVPSANITLDPETGIGTWTEDQFVNAVRFAKNPRGGLLNYPMFPHAALSDTEVRAIFAYLKTVPPVKNSVARYTTAAAGK